MSDTGGLDAAIVAGGAGTRLQPLTFATPKPLLPFCGAPFLAGLLRRLAAAGVERAFLVVGPDTAPFEALATVDLGVIVEVVPEPQPLDTAGGVRAVAGRLRGPFLVLNGDVLTDVDYAAVVAAHRASRADATIVLTRVEETSTFGVAVRAGTRVVRFVEKPPPGTLPGQDTVNAGTYVLEPRVLDHHDEGPLSFERAVFPALLERGGHIEGFVSEGVWADLGTPDRYRQGHRLALDGALPWPPLTDVSERAPGERIARGARLAPTARVVPPVLVLDGAVVAAGATVGPHAVVGRGCDIGEGATVRRAVLHDRVRLAPGVVADGLLAGEAASVETGARLGRDVVLGSGETVKSGVALADGERVPPELG